MKTFKEIRQLNEGLPNQKQLEKDIMAFMKTGRSDGITGLTGISKSLEQKYKVGPAAARSAVKKLFNDIVNGTYKEEVEVEVEEFVTENCWDDYKQVGMKKKGGKMVPNCVPKEQVKQVQEGLPDHLKKILDKKGNIDPKKVPGAKGKKSKVTDVTPKGYGPKEGVELEERLENGILEQSDIFYVKVGDGRDHIIVKTKAKNSREAVKKIKSQHPKDRVSLYRESVEEETELQEYGVRSKRSFKRHEHEFEAEMERKAAAKRKADDAETRVVWINGKVWKKNGKPVEFKDKRHAQNVIKSMMKKNPEKEFVSGSMAFYKQEGDTLND